MAPTPGTQATELVRGVEPSLSPGTAGRDTSSAVQEQEGNPQLTLHQNAARIPVELEVTIPAEEFRVRDLLSLQVGQLVATRWANGEDLPLAAGNVQLAWTEFEVIDTRLAVRVTRLA